MEGFLRLAGVPDQNALRHLELQIAGIALGVPERVADPPSRFPCCICRGEMFTASDSFPSQPRLQPAHLPAAFAQYPFSNRADQPILLGQRNEVAGRDHPPSLAAPTQQGFDSLHLTAAHVDQRLVARLSNSPLARAWFKATANSSWSTPARAMSGVKKR